MAGPRLLDHFSALNDPRQSGKVLYPLRQDDPDIVAIDGKTSRRARRGEDHPLHVVGAGAVPAARGTSVRFHPPNIRLRASIIPTAQRCRTMARCVRVILTVLPDASAMHDSEANRAEPA